MKKKLLGYFLAIFIIFIVLAGWLYHLSNEAKNRNKTLKIGILLYRQDDNFISSMRQSMEEEIDKLMEEDSDVTYDFQFFDSKNSQLYQNDIIDSLISDKYDALCINLVDRTAASLIIDRAKSADIPIVFFNREPVNEDLTRWDKLYYVGSDPKKAGMMQGELVLNFNHHYPSRLDKNHDGIIQYCLLEGEVLHQDAILRTKYALQTISKELSLENITREMADWSYNSSYIKMLEVARKRLNIELIISNNDAMALGARKALVDSYYVEEDLPYIVGIDGIEEALQLSNESILYDTIINDQISQSKKIISLARRLASDTIINHKKDRYYLVPYKNTKKKL
ncbi:galactose ABC transporter substrate-binding protein [Vagococcus xieshaowenii]|uniref:D-galactose/methyl-galactoside binding periplasmic protein MglB n=1 Tax=Vagococcus xieshaowenii TaxID=2562451 RepID=A0AAJ5JM49_9ENTE|nr:galactose ABC transporter substrate-binding protein [Vagococcus xieshaowenii]QCA28646.1 galactose ABC transporter substrate-binding protein [Vagococcus xieshaowenii]TFZ40546.1 galactose ABC transporter substrate-binding protein [Vagococcus xieshaowenii]